MASDERIEKVRSSHPELLEDYLEIFVYRTEVGREWPWETQLKRWRRDFIAKFHDEP